MDNVSVVYATRTRHSKKLADAIGKEFGVEAKNVAEHPEPQKAGLLFLVGGIYAGRSNPALLSYAEKLSASTVGKAVIVTSSASKSHRAQRELRAVLEKKGVEVAGELACAGAFLFIRFGRPDKKDMETIAKAAKDISGK